MDIKEASKYTVFAQQTHAKQAMMKYASQQLHLALQKEALMAMSQIPLFNLVDSNLQLLKVSMYKMMRKRYDWQHQPFRTHQLILSTILYQEHKRYFIGIEFVPKGADSRIKKKQKC